MATADIVLREATAEVGSIAAILQPHSIAVVGAGRRPGNVGHEVLRSLLAGDFSGTVYPVNPMVGLGGVLTDLLRDRAFAAPPLGPGVAEELPELTELDLNPILVGPAGALVVDCKARLTSRPPGPGPLFPALRRRPSSGSLSAVPRRGYQEVSSQHAQISCCREPYLAPR